MKKITTIFGAILFASTIMISCDDSTTESDAKSEDVSVVEGITKSSSEAAVLPKEMDSKNLQEEAQQNSKNDFLALLLGKVYEMGKGENMVKVSFDLENYLQDCGDLGQVGWVGSYWADGPEFTVDVNYQEKELTTYAIINCEIEPKGTYKIKYNNDNTITLTVINCDGLDSFFDGCGPFTLEN